MFLCNLNTLTYMLLSQIVQVSRLYKYLLLELVTLTINCKVMQIEKVLINNRLRVCKESLKFRVSANIVLQ